MPLNTLTARLSKPWALAAFNNGLHLPGREADFWFAVARADAAAKRHAEALKAWVQVAYRS
jgi:hypothetical protein